MDGQGLLLLRFLNFFGNMVYFEAIADDVRSLSDRSRSCVVLECAEGSWHPGDGKKIGRKRNNFGAPKTSAGLFLHYPPEPPFRKDGGEDHGRVGGQLRCRCVVATYAVGVTYATLSFVFLRLMLPASADSRL